MSRKLPIDTNASLPHKNHRQRANKIYAEGLSAIFGIFFSLLSIYWTATHGLPFKSFLISDEISKAIIISTSALYIFAQIIKILTCRQQLRGSEIILQTEIIRQSMGEKIILEP